jgi:hypothetical protein
MRFDHQQPALGVERHANRRHDVRLLRHQFKPEAWLVDEQPRFRGKTVCAERKAAAQEKRPTHNNRLGRRQEN